jgi:cytochrome c-type biogenesis CcmH protein
VLLDPSMSRNTAALWVLPLFAVTAGGAGLVLVVRRWSRAGASGGALDDAVSGGGTAAGKFAAELPEGSALMADDLEADRLDGKITDADFERLRAADDRAAASAKTAKSFEAKSGTRGKHARREKGVR